MPVILVAKKAGMQNAHGAHPQGAKNPIFRLYQILAATLYKYKVECRVRDLIIGRGCINQPETKGKHLPIET